MLSVIRTDVPTSSMGRGSGTSPDREAARSTPKALATMSGANGPSRYVALETTASSCAAAMPAAQTSSQARYLRTKGTGVLSLAPASE